MIRRYMVPLKAALMLSDGVVATALFLALVNVRLEALGGTWSLPAVRPLELAVAYGGLWVAALWFIGLYRLRRHWTLRGELVDIIRATLLVVGAALAILYVFELVNVSRLFLAMLFIAQPLVTVGTRAALRLVLWRLRRAGSLRREMLVVGAGLEAEEFANIVERQADLGLRVMGHLRGPNQDVSVVSRPVLGGLEDIEEVLHKNVVDEVAICLSTADWSYVEPVTRICEEEGKIVRLSIEPLGGLLSGGEFEEVADVPIVTFVYGPDRFLSLALKRIFDIVASALLLFALSPLLLAIAAWILAADGRPVLFGQRRIGLHGRPFTCFKFRTMVRDAEERFHELADKSDISGPAFKMANDPRITRIGHWLRRTALDELPQLWNVLRGEMSIVGPRPAPAREVDKYSVWHRRRLSMRPGLTGLWQVSDERWTDFDHRVTLDLDYIDRWSLWMDIKILARTIPVVVTQSGR